MEGISIKEILEWMDSGRPFSLTYVTADSRRGTGGSLVSYRRVQKTGYAVKDKTRLTPAVQKRYDQQIDGKNPNHFEHFTRNIILPNREVRTVHIDLITHFNEKKVL